VAALCPLFPQILQSILPSQCQRLASTTGYRRIREAAVRRQNQILLIMPIILPILILYKT
jgi:hypothetical protein